MASIILRHAGRWLGGTMAGSMGSAIGAALGSHFGARLDRKLFAERSNNQRVGGRLADLSVQTSCYGNPIPIIYGSYKIAGNIIWALPIREQLVTLAIALCEGKIDGVIRAWADDVMLDLAQVNYRLYKGDEEQLPDSLIESVLGVGKTPAYRGISYVVIEDFPLAAFANRIPNFSFEVKRTLKNAVAVEDLIEGITIIPGSGEFVYDTEIKYKVYGYPGNTQWIQRGQRRAINANNWYGKADALVALDQLQESCPQLKWVALVVCWYTNSLDIGSAYIKPGVEYQTGSTTEPDQWNVAGLSRKDGYPLSHNQAGNPNYGGTICDVSLLRYLTELGKRGYLVMLVPMVQIDLPGKPWRGHLSGRTDQVIEFFNKNSGYNQFILHYVELTKGMIDGFVIGSELVGLTKLRDESNHFPAVDELIKLAAKVKKLSPRLKLLMRRIGQNIITVVVVGIIWIHYGQAQILMW